MSRFNLSADEKDVVSDIFYHEGMKPLMKIISQMVDDMGRQVLSSSIDELEAQRREYDGAKKLYSRLVAEVQKAKKP